MTPIASGLLLAAIAGFVPGAFAGPPRASMLSYRSASLPGSSELATTAAAPAGESRPSWGRGTEIGPRALVSAPGVPGWMLQPRQPAPDPVGSLPLAGGAGTTQGAIVPVERIADAFARDLGWIGAGAAADLLSTSAALRWCSTCREANPLGWDSEARVALKVGMATAAGTGCWWLRRAGHGRAATIVRWSAFGIQALAAASNARHALRGR